MQEQTTELLLFFTYEHLDDHLQAVSKPYCDLAHQSAELLPANTQLVACLQHLLEAKDAAVRAALIPRLTEQNPETMP